MISIIGPNRNGGVKIPQQCGPCPTEASWENFP